MAAGQTFFFLFRSDEGRIDRATWWRGTVPLAVLAVLGTIGWVLLRPFAHHDLHETAFIAPLTIAAYLYLLGYAFALILIGICEYNLSAKRFRDRGLPGALAGLLPLSLLFGGALIWFIPQSFDIVPAWAAPVTVLLVVAVAAWNVVELGLRRDPAPPVTLSPAVALAQALIRCRSVTPQDGGALPLLAARLGDAGFATELVTFGDPGTPDILNLYARIGTGEPCLLFNGHVDVVPPGDASRWRFDPFAGEIADGLLYGRGACDMKGGVAAFVAAALGHVAAHGMPHGSLCLLITGDEEGPAVNGTVKLLEWALARGESFSACLVGEPTNPAVFGTMIKNGRRGSLTGELTVHGRQGHVAYPDRADNPLPHLLRLLGALTTPALDAGTAHFDPSNLELVTIDTGNPAANVIPAEARASFNIRFNDRWTVPTLTGALAERLAAVAGEARYTLAWLACNALPFVTAPGPFTALVQEAIAAETGRQPVLSTSGGTSDARFIAPHCPVVEFGLVGHSMHAVDEHAALAEIDALCSVYARIIKGVLATA